MPQLPLFADRDHPSLPADTAIQFAPFNAAMQIHRRAVWPNNQTVCGLTRPDQFGEWVTQGSWQQWRTNQAGAICADCEKGIEQ